MFIGSILDLILGDPYTLPHPIRAIGSLIAFLDRKLRIEGQGVKRNTARGGWLVVLVLSITFALGEGILSLAYWLHPWLGVAAGSILFYYMLAVRCLSDECRKVVDALETDLESGRKQVAMIVGRDTKNLTEEEVLKATVETAAENTSDGCVAPMFYMFCFGPVGALLYKAMNTMDSMVGYKNEKYAEFGKCAARLDDIVNYIPARLSGLFMIAASFLCGYDYKNAWYIFCRDRRKHASPNSAMTEAACAGALGLRLAGDAVYFGKLVKKDFIGDKKREIEAADVKKSIALMYVTTLIMFIFAVGIRMIIWLWQTK
ncbi:MAG: adenosylcobinamide-phosphate synthase CbiB [Lachnospiraceae bacterium]|nr:adenosylcobinamide-phosphate synthase CbiB [Lachnospiraceae bacterium]